MGSAAVLSVGGWLCIYGALTPFPSKGEALQADLRFDAGLRARDPSWGVRALTDIESAAAAAGLTLKKKVVMPRAMFFLAFQLETRSSSGGGGLATGAPGQG